MINFLYKVILKRNIAVCELNNSTSAISQKIQQKNLVPLRKDSWPRLRATVTESDPTTNQIMNTTLRRARQKMGNC